MQIETVYVLDSHRGRRIAPALIARALAGYREERPALEKAQILSSLEYESSHRAFSSAGFTISRKTRSDRPELRALLPGSGRIAWERPLS